LAVLVVIEKKKNEQGNEITSLRKQRMQSEATNDVAEKIKESARRISWHITDEVALAFFLQVVVI
jgi:hypothetical protein